MGLHDELAQFEDAWNKAEVKDKGEFADLPDGKYQVVVDQVRFENAKQSGRLQLAWVLEVTAPDAFKNRLIFHYRGLDRADSVEWMKQEIHTCGVDVSAIRITELPDILPELLDRVVEVTLKTKRTDKGEFQNCYINRLLATGKGSQDEDEPLPF